MKRKRIADGKKEDLDFLLDFVEHDCVPYFRHCVLQAMISNPPFTSKDLNHFNTEQLVERLWHMLK